VGGSYGTTSEDFTHALHALSTTPDGLGVERLITAEVALPDLPAALHHLLTERHLGKVLMRP
jgi:NADPH:quinone reductase-like Zn-dependent oxidoreductase